MMLLNGISRDQIDTFWPFVKCDILAAMKRGRGEYTLESVHESLLNGDMQLWLVLAEDGCKASIVTEIVTFPGKTICYVVALGGEDMDSWVDLIWILESWAVNLGADSLRFQSREGMLKKLQPFGYDKVYSVAEKDLRGVMH